MLMKYIINSGGYNEEEENDEKRRVVLPTSHTGWMGGAVGNLTFVRQVWFEKTRKSEKAEVWRDNHREISKEIPRRVGGESKKGQDVR